MQASYARSDAAYPARRLSLSLLFTFAVAASSAAAGAPNFVRGERGAYRVEFTDDGQLHRLRALDPICDGAERSLDAAVRFLAAENRLLALDARRDELVLTLEQESLTGSHVRFHQLHDGLPVWQSSLAVHLNRDRCVTGVDVNVRPIGELSIEPTLSAVDAIEVFSASLRNGASDTTRGATGSKRGPRAKEPRTGEVDLREPPTAELVIYAPAVTTRHVAWQVRAVATAPSGFWEALIDARDGKLLLLHDLARYVVDATGNAFRPNPCITLSNPNLIDQNDANAAVPGGGYSAVTLRDINDPVGGIHVLTGPFVTVAQIENPNIPPPTSPTPDFTFLRNPDEFEAANVYYTIDSTQRYIQSLGLTNVNNRSMRFDVHGVNGADNSHYVGSPPGAGFIAMGDGGVDDGEDGDVVIHEYGHAIQDNQVPGWGSTLEGGAMGEGFGDYLAGTMHYEFGYENECVAMWDATSYSGANPPCLRRLDSTKTYPGDVVGQVHADGEMWSAANWECHNAFIAVYGVSAGRDMYNQILLESQFSVPTNGGFRDGALALFTADQTLNGGANADMICACMVNRGFITNADCPGPRAAYTSHMIDDSVGDNDAAAEPGEPIVMPVSLTNVGDTPLTNVSATLTSDQPPALLVISQANATYPNMALGATVGSNAPHYAWRADPSLPCGTRVTFTLDITSTEWSGQATFVEQIGEPVAGAPASASFTGSVPIPDNNAAGISNVLTIVSAGVVASVSVSVNIPHTYIGDLVVELVSPSSTVVRLHNMSGGAAANLVRTYPVPTVPDGPGSLADFFAQPANGDWTLRVSDLANQDVGTLNGWSLNIQTMSFNCDYVPTGGCAAAAAVPVVMGVKIGGGNARMSWAPSVDPCHASYRVYQSTTPGMRPATLPGTWPTDPPFADVNALDLDASNTNTSFDWIPTGTIEYFKVVDVGTDGGYGPVGSFGR